MIGLLEAWYCEQWSRRQSGGLVCLLSHLSDIGSVLCAVLLVPSGDSGCMSGRINVRSRPCASRARGYITARRGTSTLVRHDRRRDRILLQVSFFGDLFRIRWRLVRFVRIVAFFGRCGCRLLFAPEDGRHRASERSALQTDDRTSGILVRVKLDKREIATVLDSNVLNVAERRDERVNVLLRRALRQVT